MAGPIEDVAALIRIGLRGLRSRSTLTLGSILLAAIAVAAGVVGPMYQSASTASYLVSTLRSAPDFLSGVTVDFTPPGPTTAGGSVARARGAVAGAALTEFAPSESSLWSRRQPVTTGHFGTERAQATLAALPDCPQLVVRGRCPVRRNEVALLAFDAEHTSTSIGDELNVAGSADPLRVVGIYRARSVPGRFDDRTRFESVLPHLQGESNTPYLPAPFLVTQGAVAALPAGQWFVRMDHRLRVTPGTDLADVELASRQVSRLEATRHPTTGTLVVEVGNELPSVVRQGRARQEAGRRTVTPAVSSLILVALVLLARLFAAGMDLRRPELALASIRGTSRSRLWVLALLEPVLQLLIATPVGLALGYLTTAALSRRWLVPGLPLHFGVWSAVFAYAVVVAATAVAAVTARSALGEPLHAMLGGIRRPEQDPLGLTSGAGSPSVRWGLLLRSAVVATTLAMLAVTLRSGRLSRPTVVHLLLPILLGVTAGLVATVAATTLAGWLVPFSARRPGRVLYVASRAISRRREGTWVILPLSASLAVAVFAAGIYTTASTWRASDAATRVGADLSYQVDMPLTEALALTHRLDPAGKWLMAAAAEPDPHWRKVLVDAPRLPRVGAWPGGWTSGRSATDVSRALAPGGPPVTLTGRRLRLTVDNEVRGSTDSLLFTATVVTSAGRQVSVLLGDFPHGLSTRSAPMPCTGTCRVTALSIGGPGPFAARMRGQVTFDKAYADRTPVPHFASVGWRDGNDDPSVFGPEAVTGTRVDDGAENVQIDTRGKTALAQLVPASLPAALPVLWGRTAAPDVTSQKDGQLTIATASTDVRIHRVATTESTPFYGPSATLVDATTYTDTVFGMNDGTQVIHPGAPRHPHGDHDGSRGSWDQLPDPAHRRAPHPRQRRLRAGTQLVRRGQRHRAAPRPRGPRRQHGAAGPGPTPGHRLAAGGRRATAFARRRGDGGAVRGARPGQRRRDPRRCAGAVRRRAHPHPRLHRHPGFTEGVFLRSTCSR